MAGARTRRIERIRAAMPLVDELLGHGQEMDNVWWARRDGRDGDDWMWLNLPFSVNARGDEPREESNFAVAERELDKVAEYGTQYRYDLWPGGRITTLQIRADDVAALRKADDLIGDLQYSAYLDEADYVRRQWENDHPNDDACYAEGECGCAASERKAMVAEHEEGGEHYHYEALVYGAAYYEITYDSDGDWLCPDCDVYYAFTDEQKAEIAKGIARETYRRECWDQEQKGQLCLV